MAAAPALAFVTAGSPAAVFFFDYKIFEFCAVQLNEMHLLMAFNSP
jgi:hypothetical protein